MEAQTANLIVDDLTGLVQMKFQKIWDDSTEEERVVLWNSLRSKAENALWYLFNWTTVDALLVRNTEIRPLQHFNGLYEKWLVPEVLDDRRFKSYWYADNAHPGWMPLSKYRADLLIKSPIGVDLGYVLEAPRV